MPDGAAAAAHVHRHSELGVSIAQRYVGHCMKPLRHGSLLSACVMCTGVPGALAHGW